MEAENDNGETLSKFQNLRIDFFNASFDFWCKEGHKNHWGSMNFTIYGRNAQWELKAPFVFCDFKADDPPNRTKYDSWQGW